MGGGRTGYGCSQNPLQVGAEIAPLGARPGLQGVLAAPNLGGAEGGLQGGSACRAYYGEGLGVERPQGKR